MIGEPSLNFSPSCRVNVQVFPLSVVLPVSARSGTTLAGWPTAFCQPVSLRCTRPSVVIARLCDLAGSKLIERDSDRMRSVPPFSGFAPDSPEAFWSFAPHADTPRAPSSTTARSFLRYNGLPPSGEPCSRVEQAVGQVDDRVGDDDEKTGEQRAAE